MKKIGLYALSYISALLTSTVGILLNAKWPENAALLGVFATLSLLPLFLYAWNIFYAKRLMHRLAKSKVADMNAFLVSHRVDAESTAKAKLRQLQRIRRSTTAYTVFVFALALAIAVLGGLLLAFGSSLYIACLIYSGLVFASVYARIRKSRQLVLNEAAVPLSKAEYPTLYSLARRAADCVGSTDDIVVLLTWDCSAGIVRDKARSLLQLGVVLLHTLSEQELYSILLHEFAHVSRDTRKHFREVKYHTWLSEESRGDQRLLRRLSLLYIGLDIKYSFQYTFYDYASSVIKEQTADKAMAKYGDPKIAASALLKTHYDTLYHWEKGAKDEACIYESEELNADYLKKKISLFREAITERSEEWNLLIGKEIISNNATHPTLRMRMDALGITELALAEEKSSPEYLKEMQKILEFSEDVIYEERLRTYQRERAEEYLAPLERIKKWREAQSPISAETYADLISDLKALGKNEEAEMLCDRVLEALPELSSAHAAFMKGSAMLFRYDERGMALIYRAMEQNGNYIESGVEIVGSFCTLTGREEDLLEYRKKAAQLGQKHKDEDSQISFLSKHDNLTRDTLPDGMLEEILTYIKTIDEGIIQNIYLVRKTVSETFFSSVFIIHFYGGTDALRNEIMHKIFRFLDSHPSDWQFSLFDYFDYPEIKVERIKGSLVYSKKEN